MDVDALATQGPTESDATVLTLFARNIMVTALER